MTTSFPPGQAVTLNGMQMYYVLAGRGEPLVLLHGYTGSSKDWALFFDDLAREYQLVIPDLRGHGRSTNPSKEYTHRQAASDVVALLDNLGIEHFKAIGVSGGGNILLHLATQHPSRVVAMVLVSELLSRTSSDIHAPLRRGQAHRRRIEDLLGQMPIQKKVALRAGVNGWYTAPVERLGTPSLGMTDGPNGAFTGKFFEHGYIRHIGDIGDKCPNGDNGDIGDKCCSTRATCLGDWDPAWGAGNPSPECHIARSA